MYLLYNLILFAVTLIGGSFPLWNRSWDEQKMQYLLAFSGSFLLGITFLHLIPETFESKGSRAGLFILTGFFLQQIVQRFTHGVEHGHHHSGGNHHVVVWPIFIGLAIHAFSEGLPLGIQYSDASTLPSLYFAIAIHKMPEAMLITSLMVSARKNKVWLLLVLFALITPVASMLTKILGDNFSMVARIIPYCIPIIAGSFIQISTTIFYESGTKLHEMNIKKWLAVLLGIGISLLTILEFH